MRCYIDVMLESCYHPGDGHAGFLETKTPLRAFLTKFAINRAPKFAFSPICCRGQFLSLKCLDSALSVFHSDASLSPSSSSQGQSGRVLFECLKKLTRRGDDGSVIHAVGVK